MKYALLVFTAGDPVESTPTAENVSMKKRSPKRSTRETSASASKRMRDQLKMAAAVFGRPRYDPTNEAM